MTVFPLLARELLERAAQRRTYMLRVVYAALLFTPLLIHFFHLSGERSAGGLGAGHALFEALVALQIFGIYVFVPALMCGAVAREKERGSLALLLLTRLGPGAIVLEKYLAGLAPMFSFLLLSLPVAGLAYCLGGVQVDEIGAGFCFLIAATLQAGAFSLLASVWCRTSFEAFGLSCALSNAAHLALPLAAPGLAVALGVLFPAIGWFRPAFSLIRSDVRLALLYNLPAVLLALAVLLLSCLLLCRRAFLPPVSRSGQVFGWLDRVMTRASRAAGWRALSHTASALPMHEPLEWIETKRIGFAEPVHVVRISVVLGIIAVAAGIFIDGFGGGHAGLLLDCGLAVLGALALALVAMHGANAFVTERLHRTLDVLLTTPLGSAQMMREKASVVRRLMSAGYLPVTLLVAMAALDKSVFDAKSTPLLFVFSALGSFLIDLPLVWWMALWLSAKSRARSHALISAFGGVIAFLAFPTVLLTFAKTFPGLRASPLAESLVFFSPVEMLRMIAGRGDTGPASGGIALVAPFVNLAFCFALLCAIRQHCLRRADAYLRG